MPCGYGTKYFRTALNCFLQQDYAGPLELIIVDNNTEPIEHLLSTDSRIKYVRCARMPVGALRNLGTSYATGDICISGDEDDWSASNRVTEQVRRLQESGKAVTGWHSLLFYDMYDGVCYRYTHGAPPYCCGTSQCYTKKWWERHKFPAQGVEDYYFQKEAAEAGQLDSTDAGQLCVVRSHRDSKCPPRFGSAQFPSVPRSELPQDFFTCLES
jgi:glycosyltransferase involved in cell wall biosynthesis